MGTTHERYPQRRQISWPFQAMGVALYLDSGAMSMGIDTTWSFSDDRCRVTFDNTVEADRNTNIQQKQYKGRSWEGDGDGQGGVLAK